MWFEVSDFEQGSTSPLYGSLITEPIAKTRTKSTNSAMRILPIIYLI